MNQRFVKFASNFIFITCVIFPNLNNHSGGGVLSFGGGGSLTERTAPFGSRNEIRNGALAMKNGVGNNNGGSGISSRTFDLKMTTTTSTTETPATTTTPPYIRIGKFQSGYYDKPTVFIGSSGGHDEMNRLAESLVKKSGRIVSMKECMGDEMRENMEEAVKGLDRSSVIVLDLKDVRTESEEEGFKEVARMLYEEMDMLSVYVNIHPELSSMEESSAVLKSKLEESILIPMSDFEITIKNEGHPSSSSGNSYETWDNVLWELQRLLSRASLPPAIPGSKSYPPENNSHMTMGPNTFFLSLSFPEIDTVEPYIESMCEDVDGMEFRTDLLDCREDRFELLHSLQRLRWMCRPHAIRSPVLSMEGVVESDDCVMCDSMPIVFTVRTAHQAGTWPDDTEGIKAMFGVLQLGLRVCVDVLDVESAWDQELLDAFLEGGVSGDKVVYTSQILGSHHMVDEELEIEDAVKLFAQCSMDGRAHAAKVVMTVFDKSRDNSAFIASEIAHSLAREAMHNHNGHLQPHQSQSNQHDQKQPVFHHDIPHIHLLLGQKGQYSRVLNSRFTPVTHQSLPFLAAPGQMTAAELMTTRILMHHVFPLRFGILGHQISYSVSPSMHNTAFSATKLPYQYYLIDTDDVAEFVETQFWNDANFGGLSVTIPHKLEIMKHVHVLTDSAKQIGAVNTVIVRKQDQPGIEALYPDHDFEANNDRILIGDNTDWLGIRSPLKRRLGSVLKTTTKPVALILGGGGTARAAAYAAKDLDLVPIYYNRTPSKAQILADSFGGTVVSTLDQHEDDESSLGSVLKRINGNVRVVISTLPHAANFVLPQWLLDTSSSNDLPIVFDVNYKPYTTRLLEQAEHAGCSVVRGSEMLWEQGVRQFELWTERTAPYGVMRDVVLQNCLPDEEQE